jgi:hypothetical protein
MKWKYSKDENTLTCNNAEYVFVDDGELDYNESCEHCDANEDCTSLPGCDLFKCMESDRKDRREGHWKLVSKEAVEVSLVVKHKLLPEQSEEDARLCEMLLG